MKDVLSVVTFVMGALDFAMFLVAVKPDALSAVPSPGKPARCKLAVSREPACRRESQRRKRWEYRSRQKLAESVNDNEHQRGEPM